jgi:uncharacterized protein DUF3568
MGCAAQPGSGPADVSNPQELRARRQTRVGMLRVMFVALGITVIALLVQACAALPIAVLGGAILESGAGAVVKTGTEYTTTGAAHRTFMVPMSAVRTAVLEAFDRAGVTVDSEQQSEDDKSCFTAKLNHRTVKVQLTAFSSSLTGMTLVVKRNAVIKDRATSSELLEQVEQVLAENPVFARSLHRPQQGSAAASPGY